MIQASRKYELEWERLEVLEQFASKGRRLVSGHIGQSLLKEMVPSEKKFADSKKQYF